ncbi:unnamed protein product, partial [Sphacelaria rigidula]
QDGIDRTTGKGLRMIMVHAITKHRPLAKFLWQAKLATGDYHNAMTDGMFMQWLKHRLTPAFNAQFKNKKMFLVLDNAPYHHCFDEELKVPETNSKKYNVGLLRKYGCKSFKVMRESEDGVVECRFEHYPEKLEEKAETYMREKGWGLIWTPPYMPSFQPVELFWQHGKAYVSK